MARSPADSTETQQAGILLLREMLSTSACLPMEMLHAAQAIAQRLRSEPPLQTLTLSEGAQQVHSGAGLRLMADQKISLRSFPQLIIIPSFWRSPLRGLRYNKNVRSWLIKAYEHGSKLCAVSTGSFLLAEAGLLDGRAGTTHWYYLDQFHTRYPKVKLQRRHLLTQSDRIYCAGSLNSTADLMVTIIKSYFGDTVAQRVEMQFSPEVRRGLADTLYIEGRADLHHDEDVALLQHHLRNHLREPLRMPQLSAQYQLSVRSINRRFKEVTGQTPGQYQQALRIQAARELLQKSNLSIAEVAHSVGYQDGSHFGRLFARVMDCTPGQYRNSVRGKLFSARP